MVCSFEESHGKEHERKLLVCIWQFFVLDLRQMHDFASFKQIYFTNVMSIIADCHPGRQEKIKRV